MPLFQNASYKALVFIAFFFVVAVIDAHAAAPTSSPDAISALGKQLFFDKHLSRDDSISCASCHDPNIAFADHHPLAIGIRGKTGARNTPSLMTAAGEHSFFWDGRRTTLEAQVLDPLVNPNEMGLDSVDQAIQRVCDAPALAEEFKRVFRSDVDETALRTALAAFVKSLDGGITAFDRYMEGSSDALSASAIRGLHLFEGKAGCSSCHSQSDRPAKFSDGSYHHSGVSLSADDVAALPRLVDAMLAIPIDRIGIAVTQDSHLASLGRFAVTRDPKDIGAFKTPSLRNVALTGPYMHDGSVPTLEKAVDIEIYYRSLSTGTVVDLTATDRTDIIAFLRSLTNDAYLGTENRAKPPAE